MTHWTAPLRHDPRHQVDPDNWGGRWSPDRAARHEAADTPAGTPTAPVRPTDRLLQASLKN
ncbi:hypothetical protein QJS66_18555 [Kocuria rhizophila]|nr:hypothetical protein QJS66_18555 [Kocuria rhizophila]